MQGKTNLDSITLDPYVGQTAEGKTLPFESKDSIKSSELKVFKFPISDQLIITKTREFQAVCPFSGLPDVADVKIEYRPTSGFCVELKALKYYFMSFKNVGIYQEDVTEQIFNDLSKVLNTDCIQITTNYNVRGGFYTKCIKTGRGF